MIVSRRVVALAVLVAWGLACASGQTPPAPEPLGNLKAKADLNDEDRAAVREFITQRIGEMNGGDAATARQAAAQLRRPYQGASEAFRRAYATILIELAGSAYPKSGLVPATQLLAILDAMDVVDARTLFLGALKDERVGVRASAALALRRLRPKLVAAGFDVYSAAVAALRDAGRVEKSREALRGVYEAMNYAEVGASLDLKPAIGALLDLLEARAKLHAGNKDVPALGADDAGLEAATKMLRAMSDDDKRRLAAAAGTITRFALERYLSPDRNFAELTQGDNPTLLELRNTLERLVLVGERTLAAALSPPRAPTVFESFRKHDRAATRLAWKEWATLLQAATNQDFALSESRDAP